MYTVTGNGTVYALNAATGALRWRVRLRTEVDASLAVADGAVYVPGEPGELYALKAATGARLWHTLLPGYAVSSPAVAGGVVYLGTDHTDVGDLLAFNAVTGKGVWDIQNSNGAVDATPAVANGVVYWVANGSVYATDAATATNLWSVNLTPTVMDVRSRGRRRGGVLRGRRRERIRPERGHRQPALGLQHRQRDPVLRGGGRRPGLHRLGQRLRIRVRPAR